jgi:hypothetical protein
MIKIAAFFMSFYFLLTVSGGQSLVHRCKTTSISGVSNLPGINLRTARMPPVHQPPPFYKSKKRLVNPDEEAKKIFI